MSTHKRRMDQLRWSQEADPETATCIYNGQVMHARLKPVGHRFTYSMAALMVNLDRLGEAARASSIFSIDRFNLVSFHHSDFGPRDGTPLRPHVERLLAEAGVPKPEKIRLLCYPRVLGYTFNPLAVYYCEDEAGKPSAIIYEVKNTFGEQHSYVQPVLEKQVSPAGIRQEAEKVFYVSPFLDMKMRYRFRLKAPGSDIAIRILENDREGPILAATFFGKFESLNTVNLARIVLRTLGIAWKVTAGIHFEALRLWLKGLKPRVRRPHGLTHSLPGPQD